MGQSDFERNLAKGKEGERRASLELRKAGCEVWDASGPVKIELDGLHYVPVDLSVNHEELSFFVQVKAKEPRRKYGDTGFEEAEYQNLKLLEIVKAHRVMLLFVDSKEIYGIWLSQTSDENSHIGWNEKDQVRMRYWHRRSLRSIKELLRLAHSKPSRQKFIGEFFG